MSKTLDMQKENARKEKEVYQHRISNKDERIFDNMIKFYGQEIESKEDFFKFLEEFKMLRGEYGIKKNKLLEEKLHPNLEKLANEL